MIDELMQSFGDPHARHAIYTHWPIVLTPLAAVALACFAATRFRSRIALSVGVLLLVGATVGAGLASGAGEEAYELVEASVPPLSAVEHDALERHEELGEGAWMWPAGCLVLAAGAFVPKPKRAAMVLGTLAFVGTLGVTGRFVWTAHTGGVLVYEHGLGVPARNSGGSLVPGLPADIGGGVERDENRDRGASDDDDDRG